MERTYRRAMCPPDLVSFRVLVGETDLWLAADRDLSAQAGERARYHRRELRSYMERDPEFFSALTPRPSFPPVPTVAGLMLAAGQAVGVGPMAAVAGAIAQVIALDLRPLSEELIVENGGDLYLRSRKSRTVAILAGESELSGRLGIRLAPCPEGIGLCTSSGTVGPSLSFGKADAATILSSDAALADAAATALGNRLHTPADLRAAVEWAAGLPGILGALGVMGAGMAAAGEIELVPLNK